MRSSTATTRIPGSTRSSRASSASNRSIADIAPRRPISADLLLGPERVDAAQVVKQADVLMLHHLVPDEVVNGSLGPNLEALRAPDCPRRLARRQSTRPLARASVRGRCGAGAGGADRSRRSDRHDGRRWLHLATMGGVWQALAFGFAGVRPRGERLEVDPRLPDEWQALELRLSFRGELGPRANRARRSYRRRRPTDPNRHTAHPEVT